MWRIERRLLIPAVSVLLIAGLLVPAGAAPPTKAFKPVWTLTQQYDAQGQKVATLKGVLPTDPKGNYQFASVYVALGQCYSTGCVSVFPWCGGVGLCNDELPVSVLEPTNTDSGVGWTATSELSKAGVVTVTVVLTEGFFLGNTQVIDASIHALTEVQGYSNIVTFSNIQQAFQ